MNRDQESTMTGAPNVISEYRIKLRTTHKKVLLVEGKTDKRAFELLFNMIFGDDERWRDSLIIDTAEDRRFRGSNVRGNRQIVEAVCAGADRAPWGSKIVGFV